MTYTDRTLTCVDCGVEFIHSAADQEFYVQKGFVSDPKRCTSCRASRRAARDAGDYDLRDIGGPRGYERGERPAREYFAVLCSSLRQPGPGPVQATDGPPGLLLGLLPVPFRGLIAGRSRTIEAGAQRGRRPRAIRGWIRDGRSVSGRSPVSDVDPPGLRQRADPVPADSTR